MNIQASVEAMHEKDYQSIFLSVMDIVLLIFFLE